MPPRSPLVVVHREFDHIGPDAKIGEPGDESSPQIVQSPRRRISHGGVETFLDLRPASNRPDAGGGEDETSSAGDWLDGAEDLARQRRERYNVGTAVLGPGAGNNP